MHLPTDFDPSLTYPNLLGPGDGVEGEDAGFYWKSDPYSHGWIIVDAQLWESTTRENLGLLLDQLAETYSVEGGKFHAVGWSANSAGIFDRVIRNAFRFHRITGMAGNPRNLDAEDFQALQSIKVRFVVGEKDPGRSLCSSGTRDSAEGRSGFGTRSGSECPSRDDRSRGPRLHETPRKASKRTLIREGP